MENKKPLVLVADDDEDDRYFLQLAFTESCPDCQIEFANDGVDFLDQLHSQHSTPDLVMLDINMPRMDGWEVLKTMKGNQAYQNIPIVVYSTSDDDYDKLLAKRLQASMYFTKPASLHKLNELVLLIRREWLNTSFVMPSSN